MAVPVWTVAVDWNGNGSYADAGDDISARTLDTSAIVMTYGRNQARALAPVAPGTMNWLIDNVSRDYSPDNTGSAIAPNVNPARPVKVTAVQNAVTYVMYLGFFDTYVVNAQDHTVAVSAVDALGRLGGSSNSAGVVLSTALYQGIRTGAAVGLILDAVGWPGGLRDLDAGATQIRWWWEEGTDAFTALAKIIASEGPPAICYVDAQTGNFVFRDRHHRLLRPASKIPQGSFADGGVPEGGGANLIPAADSGFETALTGNWIIWADVTALTRDTVTFFAGAASLKVAAAAAGNAQIIYNPLFAAYNGQPLTVAAEVNSPVATGMNVTVFWQDPVGGALGSATIGFGASGTGNMAPGWNAYSAVFYPPAGSAKGQAWVTLAATAAQSFYLDSFTVTPVPSVRISDPFTYDLGWSGIINTLAVPVAERNPVGAPVVVWQDNQAATYAIPASSSLVITIQAGDPFYGAVPPAAAAGDVAVLSGSIGTVTLSRTSGQATTITVPSSGGAVVGGLQLRAYPVQVTNTVQVTAVDATSVTANGIRSLPASSQPVWAGVNDAAAVAQMVLNQRAKRLPVVQVTLNGGGDTGVLTQQLARDLSDRVTVTEFETGLAGADFFIEQIQHTVTNGGAQLVTGFGCEKAPVTVQPFVLDDPVWGLLDTGGVLGI